MGTVKAGEEEDRKQTSEKMHGEGGQQGGVSMALWCSRGEADAEEEQQMRRRRSRGGGKKN